MNKKMTRKRKPAIASVKVKERKVKERKVKERPFLHGEKIQ
jgi:hypothetical protein